MYTNIYLIPNKDNTFSACFATEPPNKEAIYLTAEGAYPVIYCYFNRWTGVENAMVLKHCRNRDELRVELDRSGSVFHHRIQKLWDYDFNKSPNPNLHDLDKRRLDYLRDGYPRILEEGAFTSVSADQDLFLYWVNSRYPSLKMTQDEIELLVMALGNAMAITRDGHLIIDDNGTIMMASIHNLVELASDNARERIECAQMELSVCSDVLQRLHKFEEKLLPNIESLDDCFLY